MYKFILKCSCKWLKTCDGKNEDLSSLKEVKKGCQSCGKPRTFLCPNCGKIVKMIKVIR